MIKTHKYSTTFFLTHTKNTKGTSRDCVLKIILLLLPMKTVNLEIQKNAYLQKLSLSENNSDFLLLKNLSCCAVYCRKGYNSRTVAEVFELWFLLWPWMATVTYAATKTSRQIYAELHTLHCKECINAQYNPKAIQSAPVN